MVGKQCSETTRRTRNHPKDCQLKWQDNFKWKLIEELADLLSCEESDGKDQGLHGNRYSVTGS